MEISNRLCPYVINESYGYDYCSKCSLILNRNLNGVIFQLYGDWNLMRDYHVCLCCLPAVSLALKKTPCQAEIRLFDWHLWKYSFIRLDLMAESLFRHQLPIRALMLEMLQPEGCAPYPQGSHSRQIEREITSAPLSLSLL